MDSRSKAREYSGVSEVLGMRQFLPAIEPLLNTSLDRFPDYVIKEHVESGNNGHLFRAFDRNTGSSLAFKIVPVENLPSDNSKREIHLDEARKANLVEHPSVVKYIDVFAQRIPQIGRHCVVFVCNFIKGKNLRKYVKKNREEIDIPFVESFLRTIFELLFELQQRGLHHGDLHAGNVIVATPEYDLYQQPRFLVTDFGVRDVTGTGSHANDFLYLAAILKSLLETIDYRQCSGRDRFVFDVFLKEYLGRHLLETDSSADEMACNPREMLAKMDGLDDQYRRLKFQDPQSGLSSPFDYPNCEQIGNSNLLLKSLYSERPLGLVEIQKRSNSILTGPRGCGKTTVFRALSLDYLASVDADAPDLMKYIGVYYRCDDLYFSFPRYNVPDRTEAQDIPVHFLTVTLLAIALENISIWAMKHYEKEWTEKEGKLVRALYEVFDWAPNVSPSGNRIPSLINRLKGKERRRSARKHRVAHKKSEPIEGYFGPGIIFDACRTIRDMVSFLGDRHFYFFIDDYSHPKITMQLQENLNRMVMHRNPDVFFKLSTESPVSFSRRDIDGKEYVESREYDLLNLGLRYISSDTSVILEFLEDLFFKRFREVHGYPVQSLKSLLGSIPRNENETARAFRSKSGQDNYAGIETIAAMCSGDIHYMIRLVGSMVEDFGGQSELISTGSGAVIPPLKQHESIRAAAGSFMEAVRMLPRNGQKLADIVTAFGTVAHSYLIHENSGNQTGLPPHQASRIEPYEPLRLTEEARELLEELLRYSIFIEDPRGKSRRGKIVPRLYLRRYLVPHFQLTFSRRDSLLLENWEVETMLCRPIDFENDKRLRSKADAVRRRGRDPSQRRLFSDE